MRTFIAKEKVTKKKKKGELRKDGGVEG